MKGSTILLIVVVLWFLSTQVSKLSTSANKLSTSANNVAKSTAGVGAFGAAGANLINVGADALGKWASSSSSSSSYGAPDYSPYSGTYADGSTSTTQGITGNELDSGASYGPPAPSSDVPSAWSDDLATPDWSN